MLTVSAGSKMINQRRSQACAKVVGRCKGAARGQYGSAGVARRHALGLTWGYEGLYGLRMRGKSLQGAVRSGKGL